jgi:hypothetical protein
MSFKGNGTSQYILSGAYTTPTNYTAHCWFKGADAPTTAHNKRVWSLADAAPTVDFAFLWDNASTPITALTKDAGGTYYGATLTSTLTSGVFYGLGARLDSSYNLTAWFNGSKQATTAAAAPALNSAQMALLAAYRGTTEYCDGTIAEFGFWNTGLTDTEMLALGRGVCPLLVRPQNLTIYAPLVQNTNNRMAIVLTNSGTTVQTHPAILYADIGDAMRFRAPSQPAGSVSRNVNFQSVFAGLPPESGMVTRNANFQSAFTGVSRVPGAVNRSVNFQSRFYAAAGSTAGIKENVNFRSQFIANIGALASGRFRGRFYGG